MREVKHVWRSSEVKAVAPSASTLALHGRCLRLLCKRDTSTHILMRFHLRHLFALPPKSSRSSTPILQSTQNSRHSLTQAHQQACCSLRPATEHLINIRREWDMPRDQVTLTVGFKRTIRVSDNDSTNDLPPDLGSLPLYKTSDYEKTLPSQMAAKGGYFLPMHREYCPALART
jgi:hypothetical protein